MPQKIKITPAKPDEARILAELWHESWTFAHADLVGPALIEARSLGSFEARISTLLAETLVARMGDKPIGFSSIKGEVLYQFFMSEEGRGTGAAAQLMQVTEQKMVKTGIKQAHLFCYKDNDRAMAFYEKMGWKREELVPIVIEAAGQNFEVDNWRVTKELFKPFHNLPSA